MTNFTTATGLARLLVVVALAGGLGLAGCGKRGPLEQPQVVTGVDEEGNEIKEPAPAQDLTKPFILDPILF